MRLFVTRFCFSSALNTLIALLMHRHTGDARGPPAQQNMLAASLLFVCACFNVHARVKAQGQI